MNNLGKMSKLTVGYVEEQLRKFPKGTQITLSCGCCNHGSSGDASILGIEDRTNQTYGYIELTFNDHAKSDIKLSNNEKEFYVREVERLNKKIDDQSFIIERYEDMVNSINSSIHVNKIITSKRKGASK